MQATSASPKQLAADLLTLWSCVAGAGNSEFFEVAEELDLTFTQLKALGALATSPDELSVKELSERLGLSFPAASRTIEALLRRGWLERREDAHDRRVKRVTVTRSGRAVSERLAGIRQQSLVRQMSALTDEQRARLADVLAAALPALSPPPEDVRTP